MQYFIQHPETDSIIKEIRRKIRLSMNGVVADAMKEMGVIYRQNYGVGIPRLRQIAAQYAPNLDVAQRLWALKIRETMILATLIAPAEKFTEKNAEEWLKDICRPELTEQACMNLFAKLPYADELTLKCVFSENRWEQITGFTLLARVRERVNPRRTAEIVQRALALSDTDDFHLYKSIAVCLARLCRNSAETAAQIAESVASFENSAKKSYQYIYNEIKQEQFIPASTV